VDRESELRDDGVTGVLVRQVGSLDLLDLEIIGEFLGRDFLPYPFMFTMLSRFALAEEATAYATTVPDRFRYGDLGPFSECLDVYQDADIRVECHVQYIPSDTPSVRVMGYRRGELGFFMAQRPDADVIDVDTVSPYDLGAAISDAVTLTQPGQHLRIVVPQYAPRYRPEYDTGDFVVGDRLKSPTEVTIDESQLSAYATVQALWRPTRRWGLAPYTPAVVWVSVRDDGDYIYMPDSSYAIPMTKSILHERIDRRIADVVAVVRESRRG
jgi:hypothetical protein